MHIKTATSGDKIQITELYAHFSASFLYDFVSAALFLILISAVELVTEFRAEEIRNRTAEKTEQEINHVILFFLFCSL